MSEDLLKQARKAKADKIEALNEIEDKHATMTAEILELREAREQLTTQVAEITAAN